MDLDIGRFKRHLAIQRFNPRLHPRGVGGLFRDTPDSLSPVAHQPTFEYDEREFVNYYHLIVSNLRRRGKITPELEGFVKSGDDMAHQLSRVMEVLESLDSTQERPLGETPDELQARIRRERDWQDKADGYEDLE